MTMPSEDGYHHIDGGFDPVYDARSRVLVLGSFPSVRSRQEGFYYGNPQNRFWRVIDGCLMPASDARRMEGAPIPRKRELLLDAHIALWDVIASCDIRGSSDASIRDARPVDLESILAAARIEAVIANGARAAGLYHTYLEGVTGIPAAQAPSTSPANASWSLERLIDAWAPLLLPHLAGGDRLREPLPRP